MGVILVVLAGIWEGLGGAMFAVFWTWALDGSRPEWQVGFGVLVNMVRTGEGLGKGGSVSGSSAAKGGGIYGIRIKYGVKLLGTGQAVIRGFGGWTGPRRVSLYTFSAFGVGMNTSVSHRRLSK